MSAKHVASNSPGDIISRAPLLHKHQAPYAAIAQGWSQLPVISTPGVPLPPTHADNPWDTTAWNPSPGNHAVGPYGRFEQYLGSILLGVISFLVQRTWSVLSI